MTAIIDAHHHIWRRADLPWNGPMQPRIFGPYKPIRRDYLIGEYLDDIASCEVSRSVYVQTNWAEDAFEDEVAYVQRTAGESGYPHGIVGYADFLATDVRPQLDCLAMYRGMRGSGCAALAREPAVSLRGGARVCAQPDAAAQRRPPRRLLDFSSCKSSPTRWAAQ